MQVTEKGKHTSFLIKSCNKRYVIGPSVNLIEHSCSSGQNKLERLTWKIFKASNNKYKNGYSLSTMWVTIRCSHGLGPML